MQKLKANPCKECIVRPCCEHSLYNTEGPVRDAIISYVTYCDEVDERDEAELFADIFNVTAEDVEYWHNSYSPEIPIQLKCDELKDWGLYEKIFHFEHYYYEDTDEPALLSDVLKED